MLIETQMALRWRDLDAYNHVNNSVFLTFIEEARIKWFGSLAGPWRDDSSEPVVARTEVNYRMPIKYPATLKIRLLAGRIGNASLTIAHEIDDLDTGARYSDGNTVLVWVSPASGTPVSLPSMIRQAAERAHAGGS